MQTDSPKHQLYWSPDGRFLAFEENASSNGFQDLWLLPMTDERKPFPFQQSPFREAKPSFSPDSKFLAYTSNESGVFEVYVQTAIAGDTTTDHFAVTSDGQRFLLHAGAEGARTEYAVVLNWMADLRK